MYTKVNAKDDKFFELIYKCELYKIGPRLCLAGSGDNLRPVGSSATKEKRHFVDLSCHDRESSFVTTSTTEFGFGNLVPEKLGLVPDSCFSRGFLAQRYLQKAPNLIKKPLNY